MLRRCISHQVLDPGMGVNDPHRARSPLGRDLHVCRLAPVSTSHRIIRLRLDLRRPSLVARRFSMARSPEAVRTAAQRGGVHDMALSGRRDLVNTRPRHTCCRMEPGRVVFHQWNKGYCSIDGTVRQEGVVVPRERC